MSSDFVVRARNVSKAYEFYHNYTDRFWQLMFGRFKTYYKPYWVLRDINLEARQGESIGIIGRNGVGKSTLLQLICGITKPTTGSIKVRGRIAPILTLGAGFDTELTGRENIEIAGVVLGLKRSEIRDRFDAIADFAGVGEFIDQPVKLYSSGMYMRIAFAICVHVDADLLIVDEAFAVGDAAFEQKCLKFLRDFRSRGSLFLVTHALDSVVSMCDRAIWLDQGRIRAQGNPADVVEKYRAAVHEESDDPRRFQIENTTHALAAE